MAESTRQREAFDSYWQLCAECSIETPVTGLATSGGRVTGVETDRGLIESPAVVVASGRRRQRSSSPAVVVASGRRRQRSSSPAAPGATGSRLPWESRCP